MKRIINHIPILQYLRTLSIKDQKNLVFLAPKELLLTLSEIALNLIHKNIALSPPQILKLKKFEKQIVSLSEKKHSLTKRRKILRGGGFLKSFLDTTIPNLMLKLVRKH